VTRSVREANITFHVLRFRILGLKTAGAPTVLRHTIGLSQRGRLSLVVVGATLRHANRTLPTYTISQIIPVSTRTTGVGRQHDSLKINIIAVICKLFLLLYRFGEVDVVRADEEYIFQTYA
jgi:hypothetical protein